MAASAPYNWTRNYPPPPVAMASRPHGFNNPLYPPPGYPKTTTCSFRRLESAVQQLFRAIGTDDLSRAKFNLRNAGNILADDLVDKLRNEMCGLDFTPDDVTAVTQRLFEKARENVARLEVKSLAIDEADYEVIPKPNTHVVAFEALPSPALKGGQQPPAQPAGPKNAYGPRAADEFEREKAGFQQANTGLTVKLDQADRTIQLLRAQARGLECQNRMLEDALRKDRERLHGQYRADQQPLPRPKQIVDENTMRDMLRFCNDYQQLNGPRNASCQAAAGPRLGQEKSKADEKPAFLDRPLHTAAPANPSRLHYPLYPLGIAERHPVYEGSLAALIDSTQAQHRREVLDLQRKYEEPLKPLAVDLPSEARPAKGYYEAYGEMRKRQSDELESIRRLKNDLLQSQSHYPGRSIIPSIPKRDEAQQQQQQQQRRYQYPSEPDPYTESRSVQCFADALDKAGRYSSAARERDEDWETSQEEDSLGSEPSTDDED